jgi:hypothetical protein
MILAKLAYEDPVVMKEQLNARDKSLIGPAHHLLPLTPANHTAVVLTQRQDPVDQALHSTSTLLPVY